MTWNPELLAIVASVAILVAYHVFLRVQVRRNPNYTIQAVLNISRLAWVRRVMDEDEGILAVQTLRNVIMGATFFASTAVALIVGTITLSVQADRLEHIWTGPGNVAVVDEKYWLLKLLVLLVDLMCAFVCFSQAIRLNAHVGVMVGVPVKTLSPEAVGALFVRAGRYHTLGMRCYYFATPLVFGLFGPLLMVLASLALVWVLHRLDHAPQLISDET